MRIPLFSLIAAAAALALSACSGSGKKAPDLPSQTEAVATVGDKAITAAELKARIQEQPPLVRQRYKTLDRKKELLDSLVRFEVLLQEARRRGLDNDPDVRSMIEKVLVQRLMQVRQKELDAANTVPENELRKYYDEHLAEFSRPARVRVSQIFLASPKADPKRTKVREEAERLLADIKVKEAGPNRAAFSQAAAVRSDDLATKGAAGDLGFKTRDELAQAWAEPVALAAMGLKGIGDLSAVVETDKGFHLLKLAGRQEGVDQSFDSMKPRIESRLGLERRAHALDDFVADLKAKANVKIDEQALGRVEVEASATTPPPLAPHP